MPGSTCASFRGLRPAPRHPIPCMIFKEARQSVEIRDRCPVSHDTQDRPIKKPLHESPATRPHPEAVTVGSPANPFRFEPAARRAEGAAGRASSKPNLLNVALTRAQAASREPIYYRLCSWFRELPCRQPIPSRSRREVRANSYKLEIRRLQARHGHVLQRDGVVRIGGDDRVAA